jgi:DNA-nicking Smr family endonuclease
VKRKKPAPAAKTSKAVLPDGHRPFASLKDLKARLEKEAESPGPAPAPPARSSAKAAPKPPPEDDALTLHRMMSGVTPLDSKARRIPRSEASLPSSNLEQRRLVADEAAEMEAREVHAHLQALVEGGRFEVDDDGRRVEGRRAGLPQEVLRKLRRGLYPVDARLDLHGLRAEEARDRLERFLGEKRARGERCVLIVHGKGEHSPARIGILRGEMAAWLSQGHASVHVTAFATAEPQDGGEGATYVLLVR